MPSLPQHISVLGCAISGMAAARLAAAKGCTVTVLDEGSSAVLQQRAEELRAAGIRVVLGPAALTDSSATDLAVLSPGMDPSWALPQAFVKRGIATVGEIEFAWQFNHQPVIAITGTNGKTTTTELISQLMTAGGIKTVPGGNYGVAFSQILLDETPVDIHTLELSSFQLETIDTFRPKVAVWLNFAPDHLDRHPSMEAYRSAKLRIFENQTAEDFAVVNAAEPLPELKASVVTFSAYHQNADFHIKDECICFDGRPVLALSSLRLRGKHNVENVMAAMATAHVLGVSFASMREPLSNYAPAPHRCELVTTYKEREFINDSKATNVHATESAIRGLGQNLVLILGGKQKGLDYEPLRPLLTSHTTDVVTFGEIGQQLADTLQGTSRILTCETLPQAVQLAYQHSQPGQIILFSPATSSFDQFQSYAHRGETFRQCVAALASPISPTLSSL